MKTDQAIEFINQCRWEDLPDLVRRQARLRLLDATGAMLAGFGAPVASIMTRFARANLSGDRARILVGGEKVSLAGAALANGFAANALDIDDGHRLVKGHPGACLAPLLFPALEAGPALTGRELLTALVCGYELAVRAGMIRHELYPVYHSSGSWGAVAGAALVGRLWGFDRTALRRAMGAAEYHAPIGPMMKGIAKPAMVKDSIGWGCLTAMSSALLAADGFSGVEPMFSDAPDPGLIDELGRRWRIMDCYFKPYACCRWAQPAAAGAVKVMTENRLKPDDVAVLEASTFAAAAALPNGRPANTEEAQYNLAFPTAAAVIDGRVGPDQILPPRLFDPDLLALADKVKVTVNPEFETAFPRKTLAEITIVAADGRTFSSGPMEPGWEPPDGLPGRRELVDKFHWLVDPVLGEERAAELARFILSLDERPDSRPLVDLAVRPG